MHDVGTCIWQHIVTSNPILQAGGMWEEEEKEVVKSEVALK